MTEELLILNLQSLKNIKPSTEWAVSVKANIFASPAIQKEIAAKPAYQTLIPQIISSMYSRKLAYSFAVFLFLAVAGIVGVAQYNSSGPTVANNTQKAPSRNLIAIKSNVEDFKTKSKNLSQIANLKTEDIALAVKEVKEVAAEITDAINKDPELAREVALEVNNNKTLLNVQGSEDLKETSDNLYGLIVEQLIKDFDKMSLADGPQKSVDRIKSLFEQKKFMSALEDALLLDMAIKSN